MAGPAVGEIQDGYRFKGGNPANQDAWEQVEPVDVSDQWGAGARQLPNGTIERVGPRGGVSVIANTASGEEGVGKLTEGQGKAMLYGGMMAGAERDYQAARQSGYDPTSFRNQAARIAGVVPFDGDFFGRLIRDDVSDAGNQAELRWAEGNLRQLTGAAATNPEIARVAAINFDRGNDELAAQRYRSRAETYQGTKYAAGAGASQLPEYPGINPAAGRNDPETGLPTYPGIQAAVAAGGFTDQDAPMPGGPQGPNGGGPIDPNAPQPGDTRVSAQPLAPTDTPESLRAQGYEYDPARDTWSRTRREPVANWTPDGAVAQRREWDGGLIGGIGRRADAFVRGAADVASAGFADEAAGFGDAFIGRGNGRDFGERRANNTATQRAVDRADQEDVPITRMAGQVAGAALTLPTFMARGAPIVFNALRGAGAGAGFGAAYGQGSGTGNSLERTPSAAAGGGIGAATGALAPVVAPVVGRLAAPVGNALQAGSRFAGRQIGRLGEAVGVPGAERLTERATPNALNVAATRFGQRSPQDVNALRSNVDRFRAENIEPTFADVVNDGGRGTLRATASRQTPARQEAREFAANRATGLQDRVSMQARRTVSGDPRSPAEIRSEITGRRNANADREFGAVRGDMIAPDRGVLEALRTPAMRPAIEEAMTASLNRGDMETATLLRNLTDDALEYGADAQITVGMADRIARSLNGRAEAFQRSGNNDAASSYFALAERLRGSARQQAPGYDSALKGYAQDSGLAQATELGESFMTMEADEFAAAVARMSPEEQQIAQAAARRAIERAAGTQGAAPGVAQRLSGGREQTQRSQALLGDAEPMQRAMGTELEALRNAQAINPMQGSPTSLNAQDAMGAAGAGIGAVRDMATGNVGGLVARVGNMIRARGFNDQQAEAIVRAAIDPQQTDALIAMLSENMTRREARNLARTIRYQVTVSNTEQQARPVQ